jgi:aromatic-L-amino-acid/L-tryptophan decarboxylase
MTRSLDPEDWEQFRAAGHRAVDDMVDWWAGVGERSVWRPVPEAVKAALATPLPRRGADLEEVYARFRALILP